MGSPGSLPSLTRCPMLATCSLMSWATRGSSELGDSPNSVRQVCYGALDAVMVHDQGVDRLHLVHRRGIVTIFIPDLHWRTSEVCLVVALID